MTAADRPLKPCKCKKKQLPREALGTGIIECRRCNAVLYEPPKRVGSFRLCCRECDREDCIGLDAIPAGWTDVLRDKESWYTHTARCTECSKNLPVKQRELFAAVK